MATFIAAASINAYAIEPGQFYRYKNEQGVKVISHSIPPEYAQKGYQIINRAGQIIKDVPPAPDPDMVKEEEARLAKERELKAEYSVLARRYSSEKEIYAARDRRLTHIEANIAILNSNIHNLQKQIDEQMSKAADYERNARQVPATLLENLRGIREEKQSTEQTLAQRELEKKEIFETFEKSAALYRQGKALEAQKALTGNE